MKHVMETLIHLADLILRASMKDEYYIMLTFMFRSLVLSRF